MEAERHVLLAIDTATAFTGIAIFDGGVVAELEWHAGQTQTTELLPAVSWLLERQGWGVDVLGAVAVSLGPGSFNGLRVGISVAKALAFARDLACVGIGTLEATAYQFAMVQRAIRPIYDAGRGEVATALYRHAAGGLEELEAPRLTTVAALSDEISEPTIVCGEARPAWVRLLGERAGALVSFPSEAGMVRRPGYLAELGWRRWRAGKVDDVVGLQPIYLRRPAITLPKTK